MKWVKSWGYLPIDYDTVLGTLENVTQRAVFWNNVNGSRLKVRFSNRYGKYPLVLEKVRIGHPSRDDLKDMMSITVAGNEQICLSPGEEIVSDEILFHCRAGEDLVITAYLAGPVDITSGCGNWAGENWISRFVPGDHGADIRGDEWTSSEVFPFVAASDPNGYDILVGITDIYVLTEEEPQEIALFGDSITHMSFYANGLMKILYSEYPGQFTVTNKGYGGNRLLKDASYAPDIPGHGKCAGPAGVERFEENVYGDGTPEYVLVLEGINDLMHPYAFGRMEELPTATDLTEGLTRLARIAHAHDSRIGFCTILPMIPGVFPFGEKGEEIRNQVNEWIRHQKISDLVVDFDMVCRDEKNSNMLKEELHVGDGLHPNRQGGREMAEIFSKELCKITKEFR